MLIDSPAPDAAPVIQPNYLTADYDREVIIGTFRYLCRLFAESPIRELLASETLPRRERAER